MKHLIINEAQMSKLSLLNEISLADAKIKFYQDIPDNEFNQIISWDSANGNNMTPLRGWLLSQYKNGLINDETKPLYAKLCQKYNALPSQVQNKLNNNLKTKSATVFKDIDDFQAALNDIENTGGNVTKAQKAQQDTTIIYEDDNWKVLIPHTYESSYKNCQSIAAHWCTGAGENGQYNGRSMFQQYTTNPSRALVMFICKTKKYTAYQIAQTVDGRITDCMDYYDDPVRVVDMYDDYIGIDGLDKKVDAAIHQYFATIIGARQKELINKVKLLKKWDNVLDVWKMTESEWYTFAEKNNAEIKSIQRYRPYSRLLNIAGDWHLFLYSSNDNGLYYYGKVLSYVPNSSDGGFFLDINRHIVHLNPDTQTEEIVLNVPVTEPESIGDVERLTDNLYVFDFYPFIKLPILQKGRKTGNDNLYVITYNGNIVGDTSYKTVRLIGDTKVAVRIDISNLDEEDISRDDILDVTTGKYELDNRQFSRVLVNPNHTYAFLRNKSNKNIGQIYTQEGLSNVIIENEGGLQKQWRDLFDRIFLMPFAKETLDHYAMLENLSPQTVKTLSKYIGCKGILDIREMDNVKFTLLDGTLLYWSEMRDGKLHFIFNDKLEESKETPSIYDQMSGKSVNSAVMSMAAGSGMLGENDATDDTFTIACPDGDNYAHINEEAEKVKFEFNGEQIRAFGKDRCHYDDDDSYAFGEYEGKMYISKAGEYHCDIIPQIVNPEHRYIEPSDFSVRGRFWSKRKCMSFWYLNESTITPGEIKRIVIALNDATKDRDDLRNENFFDYTLYYKRDINLGNPEEYFTGYRIPIREYLGMSQAKAEPSTNNGMSNKNFWRHYEVVAESTNPKTVDLSSFKVQKDLNKKFWKNDKLDSKIRLKLLDIAEDFYKSLDVSWVKPKDIIMTGSLANFNWSKEHSDIDLHIVMDFKKVDERVDFVKHYFDAQKNLWNQKHEKLEIKGFPVEVYVQDINETAVQGGTYSLNKDKWINKPQKEEMSDKELDKDYIRKEVAQYIDRIEEIEQNYKDCKNDSYKARKLSEKSNALFDEIKNQRRDGLKKDNKEMSNDNIIFKALRRLGYLDRLDKMRNLSYDKEMSLNENYTAKIK